MTDGDIDTVDGLTLFKILTLVDDSIDRHGSLTYLTVADDKFSLSTAYRHHGVNRLYTGLQRLLHRLTEDDAGSLALQRQTHQIALNRAASVDRLPENIDDTSQQTLAHRN